MADKQAPEIPEDEFMKDAQEGLSHIQDPLKLSSIVDQLNKGLELKLSQQKQRKEKRMIREYPWIYLAIFIILLLSVLTYWVINKMSQ